jgi:hypothetical protein
VWLRRVEDEHQVPTCVVVAVDAYPPHRRELAPTARPVPPGADDLAPFIWQRWEQVCHRWQRLVPDSRPTWENFPATTAELLTLFDETDQLWWRCGEPAPVPVVVNTECLGDRVVGFRRNRDDSYTRGSVAVGASHPEALDEEAAETTSSDVAIELMSVKGVGELSARRLHAAGINTIEELSRRTPSDLNKILGPGFNVQQIHTDALHRARNPE